ncbi:MAG: zinc ribbon domain-containing protein [Fimbriimonadaceae bacterium]|nr:zinc ribbon domain-containing protein [Fimbriimonadaceae bacterium]
MPTYVYECSACGVTKEAEQRMSDPPLADCDCGRKGSLKRLIQPAGILFKGSGFHSNDYCSAPSEAQAEPCGPACECSPEASD